MRRIRVIFRRAAITSDLITVFNYSNPTIYRHYRHTEEANVALSDVSEDPRFVRNFDRHRGNEFQRLKITSKNGG